MFQTKYTKKNKINKSFPSLFLDWMEQNKKLLNFNIKIKKKIKKNLT